MDERILNHFKINDPVLFSVISKIKPLKKIEPRKSKDHFSSLCQSIINQQLSNKAAATIWKRFCSLFAKKKPTPTKVLEIKDEDVRKAGISAAKVRFIKNLAETVLSKEVDLEEIDKLKDEAVISKLTQVKGIGIWTAEMFLIFSLGREDVFSYGDLGLQNAIKRLYKPKNLTKKQIEKISGKWSPYRTWASRILWRSNSLKSL